ncbi:cytochrome c biogenesis protein CcdA [Reichenbachiella sp.]|uniref:protein-disulfide reductase DsbD family protein n=1 Tax=Reichenbachiella sp. TaxID=2184521 RepID=UPI0032980970
MKSLNQVFLTCAMLLQMSMLQAQIVNPVKWVFSTRHINGNQHAIQIKAHIDKGWAVYSQYLESEDGPVATSITFENGDHFELVGRGDEDPRTKKEGYDEMFDMNLVKYYKYLDINQKVIVHDFSQPINGYVTFMTCDETRCLPPEEVEFSLRFTPIVPANSVGEKKEDKSLLGGKVVDTAKAEEVISNAGENMTAHVTVESQLYGVSSISSFDLNDCTEGFTEKLETTKKTIAGIFILGMLGGFLALLTPCVFPLIPLTVSFFAKSSENKKKGYGDAILYGVFILGVYGLLSAPFHLLDSINPDILNEISTNVWLNLAFFVIFLFFAFSFFGYYEITIPSGLTNKVSAAEGVGGIIGIFFMALTLSLVSFSCTGPILGSLLAGALSSDGGAWQLTAGMTGFGLALALPFTLFALFPGWLNKIPKSGGWLNSVKVVLGFVELALALKFLSNADLVMHWGVLKYELFLTLWIAIGIGLSLYLFKFIGFVHDSKSNNRSVARLGLGTVAIVFTIYLALGLIKNKETHTFTALKLLSGLAPPVGYSWIYPNDCPNDINCFKDLESGLAYAREKNKPVLLDFTGYACVNCRKMEEHVWSDKKVFDLINDDYVLISLYVDDKKELPESEQLEVDRIRGGKRKLKSYGHKWAHFQTKFFNTNSQPYYALLTSDGKQLLSQPVGYTPDVGVYEEFLKCGLESFKNQQTNAISSN